MCASIAPSPTLAIDAKAKEMRRSGRDVVSFSVGEPDFVTPQYIRTAAHEALDMGLTKYTPAAGTLGLRRAICEKLRWDNGLEYSPSEVIVSNGAKFSIYAALAAIVNPGDEVIIPTPCWVSYPEIVRIVGGVPVLVQGDVKKGFVTEAEDLAPYVTERTKALILNSPNNPNGCIWNREQLAGIAKLAVEKGFYVVSDEIYEKLIYDGEAHVSIASLGDEIRAQTIVVNGVSKSYAMTGWRIGYVAGPKAVIRAMTAFQSHSTSNPNSIAQHAAAVALTNGEKFMHDSLVEFDARRRLMHQLISEIPGLSAALPKGAFYMMLNISALIGKSLNGRAIRGSDDLAEMLLESQKVAVVPARAFGDDRYVRLSYATSRDKITLGLARIAEFVKELE